MFSKEGIRAWVSANIQPLTFLVIYFFTAVLGNVVYATPWGAASLRVTGFPTDLLSFSSAFSVGYWCLLLMPFLVTPLVVPVARHFFRKPVASLVSALPEFGRIEYLAVAAICYAYVARSFIQANVFGLYGSGTDSVSSVEARFSLLSGLGFFDIAVLQSLLTFLAFYSVVRAIKGKELFWGIISIFNVLLMSVFLTLLNMKWPILVFYMGIIASLFLFSTKRPFIKSGVGAVMLVAVYLLISTQVFRIVPDDEPMSTPTIATSEVETTPQADLSKYGVFKYPIRLALTSVRLAPILFAHAVNRMAVSYPYYYEIFTNEGAVCGGVIEQARRGVECRPSTFVYSRIFGQDGFEGRGTAPAAVHISAYALGGWPLALFALVAASAILSLFSCLPLQGSSMAGGLAIVGTVAGYHFSQIPGEGPIFYDHGFFWLFLALGLYALCRWGVVRVFGQKTR